MKSLRKKILVRVTLSILLVELVLLVSSVVDRHQQLNAAYDLAAALAEATGTAPPDYNQAVPRALRAYAVQMTGAILFVLLVTVLLVHLGLERLIYRPVRTLISANTALREGLPSPDEQIPEQAYPDDEFGAIMASRAQMLDVLFTARDNLQKANQNLEGSVRARTAEVADALKQLQVSQTQLMQAEKLSTLGSVSASLAHDLAHPLTAIRFHAYALRKGLQPGSDAHEQLQRILEATDQAKEIVDHFRQFSRKPQSLHEVDVNGAIRRSCTIIEHQLYHDHIRFEVDLQPGLPVIWGDEVLLQQMALNLIANARDAVLEAKPGIAPLIRVSTATRNGEVELEVADNGCGMSAIQQEHIFESLYTTKPPGKGTGLGLPIVRSIVERLGGTITVASRPGEGATFTATLPPASSLAGAPESDGAQLELPALVEAAKERPSSNRV